MRFCQKGSALLARHNGESIQIEPWGPDALRVRSTMLPALEERDWALTQEPSPCTPTITLTEEDFWVGDGTFTKVPSASIENGRIRATINFAGVLTFYRDGEKILQ